MKQIITAIFLALLVGCNRPAPERSVENQIPRVVTEQEARQIASEHANAFLKDKRYTGSNGIEHQFPEFPPTTWHSVAMTTNGWVLLCEPPAGPYAHVKMGSTGKNVKVTKYGFSSK